MDKAIYSAFVNGASRCTDLISAISRGGPVNFQRKLAANTTALMAAAHWKRTDIVKRLLEQGALKSLCDSHGRTALDFAIQQGHGPTIKILSEAEDVGATGKGRPGGKDDGSLGSAPMHLESNTDSDEVYDYFVMTDAPGLKSTSQTKHGGRASASSTVKHATASSATKSASARIKSYHVSLFGGCSNSANDISDSEEEYNGNHLQWGMTGNFGR